MARSIGWMTTLANVAADPPQTNGSAILAALLPFPSTMVPDQLNRLGWGKTETVRRW